MGCRMRAIAAPKPFKPRSVASLAWDTSLRYHQVVMDALDRITHDPAMMGGKPCIRGMRVTVGTIMGLLASGQTEEQILAAYPYLELDDLRAALAYAAWRTQETELPLP